MDPPHDGEQIPRLIRDVLRLVFQMLSVNDLKCCRQVCKEWCQESSAIMRQVVPVVVLSDSWTPPGKHRISAFQELMKGEGKKNVFSLVPPFNVDITCELKAYPRNFWEFCGAAITKLSLKVAKSQENAFRYAVFECCVNLEELIIKVLEGGGNVKEPDEWVPPSFPPNHKLKSLRIGKRMVAGVSWMEILSQFPGLEMFKAEEPVGSLAGFFHSLEIARKHDNKCWKIKHLQFYMDLIDNPLVIVPALEDRNLPLRTLKVKYIDRSEDAIALRRILAVHGPTLKDLSLYGGYWPEVIMDIFPLPKNGVLENVTNLSLQCAHPRSVNFLKTFPNLRKLKLGFGVTPTPQFAEEPVCKWILSSCTKLEIHVEDWSHEDVRRLMSRLPNHEKWKISDCNNDQFAVICELLPRLVKLCLYYSLVDDTGISGLNEEDVRRINENGEEGGWWPNTWMARPNLSRLKNLQRFYWFASPGIGIDPGYTSAVYVQQLPQLQQFRFTESS